MALVNSHLPSPPLTPDELGKNGMGCDHVVHTSRSDTVTLGRDVGELKSLDPGNAAKRHKGDHKCSVTKEP